MVVFLHLNTFLSRDGCLLGRLLLCRLTVVYAIETTNQPMVPKLAAEGERAIRRHGVVMVRALRAMLNKREILPLALTCYFVFTKRAKTPPAGRFGH
jgi:hypothetical protein